MNILNKDELENLLSEYGVQYTDCLAERLIIEIKILVIDRMNKIVCEINENFTKGLIRGVANGISLPKGHSKKNFEEIVVEYPPADLCTYPEYRGKPYFSIKYEENGKHFVGFGTYKSEVFSQYLRDYFIEADKE